MSKEEIYKYIQHLEGDTILCAAKRIEELKCVNQIDTDSAFSHNEFDYAPYEMFYREIAENWCRDGQTGSIVLNTNTYHWISANTMYISQRDTVITFCTDSYDQSWNLHMGQIDKMFTNLIFASGLVKIPCLFDNGEINLRNPNYCVQFLRQIIDQANHNSITNSQYLSDEIQSIFKMDLNAIYIEKAGKVGINITAKDMREYRRQVITRFIEKAPKLFNVSLPGNEEEWNDVEQYVQTYKFGTQHKEKFFLLPDNIQILINKVMTRCLKTYVSEKVNLAYSLPGFDAIFDSANASDVKKSITDIVDCIHNLEEIPLVRGAKNAAVIRGYATTLNRIAESIKTRIGEVGWNEFVSRRKKK